MTELETAIAQIFRRKGKAALAEKDFVFAASLDFGWFGPKDAQKLLELGLESELLAMENGMVKPTFDYKALEISKGFAPTTELFQTTAQPKGIFLKIVESISRKTDLPAKDLISQINQTQDRMGVEVEVAALIVARNYEVDVSEYMDIVEEEIGKKIRND
jgi:hypothetical protein